MKTWIAVLLITLPAFVFAGSNTPKDTSDAFFKTVLENKISLAYDQLFKGSSIPKDKPQAVSILKQQTQTGLPIYGDLLGYEFIEQVNYGSSISRLVYVLKSEKGPTVWEFYYYKPKGTWFIGNVIFNDQFALLK